MVRERNGCRLEPMKLLPLISALVLVACGGSTDGSPDGGGGSPDGSMMQPTDSGNGGMDGTTMDDSSTGTDGGGGMSNPGKVDCGMMTCMAGTEVCCISGGGFMSDAGPKYTCQAPMAQCQGARIGCDESADCMMGSLCCAGLTGVRCSMMGQGCGMGSVQVCKTNQECGDAGTCTVWTCPVLGKVQSCTKPFQQCM